MIRVHIIHTVIIAILDSIGQLGSVVQACTTGGCPLRWSYTPLIAQQDGTLSRHGEGPGLDGSRMWPNCGGVALVYYQPFLCLACMSELRRLGRCEPRRILKL